MITPKSAKHSGTGLQIKGLNGRCRFDGAPVRAQRASGLNPQRMVLGMGTLGRESQDWACHGELTAKRAGRTLRIAVIQMALNALRYGGLGIVKAAERNGGIFSECIYTGGDMRVTGRGPCLSSLCRAGIRVTAASVEGRIPQRNIGVVGLSQLVVAVCPHSQGCRNLIPLHAKATRKLRLPHEAGP